MSIAGRSVTFTVATALVVAATAGCALTYRQFTDTITEEEAITEIRVSGGSGDVLVKPGAAGRVDVVRTVRYHRDAPDAPTHHLASRVLELSTSCGPRCTVSYVIQAPVGVKISGSNGSGNLTLTSVSTVDFELGSGDVMIRNATGPVRLRTASGNIELTGGTGTVTAGTGSGDVTATDIKADKITLDTSSGNIDLVRVAGTVSVNSGSGDLTGQALRPAGLTAHTSSGNIQVVMEIPTDVSADTGSGDVELSLPTGPYVVDARTGSGDLDLQIPSDPAGRYRLVLRTDSGNITLTPV